MPLRDHVAEGMRGAAHLTHDEVDEEEQLLADGQHQRRERGDVGL